MAGQKIFGWPNERDKLQAITIILGLPKQILTALHIILLFNALRMLLCFSRKLFEVNINSTDTLLFQETGFKIWDVYYT